MLGRFSESHLTIISYRVGEIIYVFLTMIVFSVVDGYLAADIHLGFRPMKLIYLP